MTGLRTGLKRRVHLKSPKFERVLRHDRFKNGIETLSVKRINTRPVVLRHDRFKNGIETSYPILKCSQKIHLEISKAHIVGLSQGGAIALQFALDYPEFADKLILVDSGALGAKPSILPFIGMLWMNSAPSRLASRYFSRYLLFNPENRDPSLAYYSIEILKREGGKNAFFQGRGSAVSAMPQELLRKIKNDTLIIWGEHDRMFSIEHGEAAARIMPNATFYRIENAGHMPLMDQPDTFNKALLGFLSD